MTLVSASAAPATWTQYRLRDCLELINGRAYSQHELLESGRFKVIRIQNLNGGSNWYFSNLELGSEKYCEDGDLLFAWSASFGPYIWRGPKAIFHYHIWNVRPRSDVLDRDFAYFLLLSITSAIRTESHGVAMLHFTKEAMENYKVELPCLVDQRLIASRLKEQLTGVEQARKAAQRQSNDAELLVRRILAETSNEMGNVKRVKLGELLKGIESGKSFQTLERLADDGEMGVLKVSAVSWTEFRPSEAKAVDARHVPSDRHRVREGDLLMTRANTVELVGAVVRVDRGYPNRLLSDKTLRLVLDETRIHPDYLLQMLRMPEARKHIESNATGTSNSMRNISQDTIQSTPIPLLPLAHQQRLSRRLLEVEAALSEVRQEARTQLSDIEDLPVRLVSQVFETT